MTCQRSRLHRRWAGHRNQGGYQPKYPHPPVVIEQGAAGRTRDGPHPVQLPGGLHAQTQNNLAATYQQRIAGVRRDNLEAAIRHYEEALTVRTLADFPVTFALRG
jgi:hypothetical protein